MTKPKALDLFCGGGGACEGLMRAGFDVVGVDIVALHGKRYPGLFIHGDALRPPVRLEDFDMVWASPPCQAFSQGTPRKNRAIHPNLIEPIRSLLSGHAFSVIENVPAAPIRMDLALTGGMVGLPRIVRRRHFEMSFFCLYADLVFPVDNQDVVTITKSMCATNHYYRRKAQGKPGRVPQAEAQAVMGIEHYMTTCEIGEAVPPAYADLIGRQIISRLKAQSPQQNKSAGGSASREAEEPSLYSL